jgi:hypothetical protein
MKLITLLLTALFFCPATMRAQVPVREEPFHRVALENKYFRLLDVWIRPGDTSQYHIHSTPSLFLHFTDTWVCTQVFGRGWTRIKNLLGTASYRSFINDTMIHRVSNCDTVPFHVTDIELLSSYNPATTLSPLPFKLLFENERAFAYRLTGESLITRAISGRGPIVAELVAGDAVTFHDEKQKNSTTIQKGKFLYVEPGSTFYFSHKGDKAINLVLFELK